MNSQFVTTLKRQSLLGLFLVKPREPIPADKWVKTSDYSLFKGSEILDALKKINFVPTSEKKAIKSALFVLKAYFEVGGIFCTLKPEVLENYRKTHNIKIDVWDEISSPSCSKKENYYEISLFGDIGFKGLISNYIIKLGKGVYEIITEKFVLE